MNLSYTIAVVSLSLAALAAAPLPQAAKEPTPFQEALEGAARALERQAWEEGKRLVDRALERDGQSIEAWDLRARWAQGKGDRDELVYALHMQRRLAIAQKLPKEKQVELRKRLEDVDDIAPDLLDMNLRFVKQLLPLAEQYEKEGRPHSAIRVHNEILLLEPERAESAAAIQRLAAAPDPSLAESAKPKNLLDGISEEWIRDFDRQHNAWETRAKLQRENYTTYTDAGYEVLVRAAEAMEQMNAFYRQFFNYGTLEDKKSVSRIDLNIFKSRDEYLKLGIGPPVEWSAGHFTGGAVECYVDAGGFEGMTGTLFHEAAHQFVSLATNAAGWMNEGLASFFEGTRILANGTVLMNMPANHRLFPLVDRMNKGWMDSAGDGIDPKNPSKSEPPKAPTFRIVLENKYDWGPPWYAPTWGVVYFLYNYQDPVDGRFVYRPSFRKFINSSGGRIGEGAVENFEKIVLANPAPPTKGVDFSKSPARIQLPATVNDLSEVWKKWLTALRDEQMGKVVAEKPYLPWARYALTRKDFLDAAEHFEKGLVSSPNDTTLLLEFAQFLGGQQKNTDRASKLALQALRLLEAAPKPDEKAIRNAEAALAKWDPKRKTLDALHKELWATADGLAQRYLAADLNMMAMDVSWRFGNDLGATELFAIYEKAFRKCLKSLTLWKLAYNEKNLEGWRSAGVESFAPEGTNLRGKFSSYDEEQNDYQFLTLDTVTSGDFSVEAEVQVEREKANFCGLVFGRKSDSAYHALLLYPGRNADPAKQKLERQGTLDLTSFYGGSSSKVWRHNPVDTAVRKGAGTQTLPWHKLRLDVAGSTVDVWFDNAFVVSQNFENTDVVRGAIGLMIGRGECRFRNIRYLPRPARDPGAEIERRVRMEKLAQETGGRVATGSWLGLEPPFPTVKSWLQVPRTNWKEKGPVPQVFVLWSIEQNNLIPIHDWLRALAEKYADAGLEIVSIASFLNEAALPKYLEERKFPGSVAVDVINPGGGIGVTFTEYDIARFFCPRLILIDIDGKVAWEGDPGLKSGVPWTAGMETYLDAPLEELLAKRKARELFRWRKNFLTAGKSAMSVGDLKTALPLLREAMGFDAQRDPSVAEAQAAMGLLESALKTPEAVGVSLARDSAEAAIEALAEWAAIYGKPFDANKIKAAAKPFLDSANGKAWAQAKNFVKAFRAKTKGSGKLDVAKELAEKLAPLPGALPRELAVELQKHIDAGQNAEIEKTLQAADTLATRLLAREYLKW